MAVAPPKAIIWMLGGVAPHSPAHPQTSPPSLPDLPDLPPISLLVPVLAAIRRAGRAASRAAYAECHARARRLRLRERGLSARPKSRQPRSPNPYHGRSCQGGRRPRPALCATEATRHARPLLSPIRSICERCALRATDVYKYCSPTRSSLMSGRIPAHVNQNNLNNDIEAPSGVDLRFTMLPQKLKLAGYTTSFVGKW